MTALAARTQLQDAIVSALPLVAVYPMSPAQVSGPSVVIAPAGWSINNGSQVAYRVEVSCLTNKPDTTQALEDLEAMGATAWLAALGAGWNAQDMSDPAAVTYADQPYLAMTFTASRLVTLAT